MVYNVENVMRRWNHFILYTSLILLVVVLTGCGEEREKLMEEKQKMEQYLAQKYGRDFVVEDIKIVHSAGLGSPKEVEAQVHRSLLGKAGNRRSGRILKDYV